MVACALSAPIKRVIYGYITMKASIAVRALSPYIFAILSVGLISSGYNALPIYCGLAVVLYPVLVAMLANDWEKEGLVYRESTLVEVDVNVRGILITEQRRHLENLYFVSPEIMQAKLTRLARIKLLLCGAMFAVSLYELALQAEAQFALPAVNMLDINLLDICGLMIGLGAVLFLGHCARKSLSLYEACRHKNYLVHSYDEPGAQLYSATIALKGDNLQVRHTRIFDALLAWY
ncbi:hypothetical protein I6H43_04485 [Aeromonas jandaei]|uniref:Uncharacterized protein n=2 Tax=Aeromonas jandaei TaxID=650 RepID=A0A7T4DRP8_AERJA|nr:hypothetical protein I6H43_04485 [Aeromonas jandaei]